MFLRLSSVTSERFDLAHIQPALDDLAGKPLGLGVSDQRPGVACRKLCGADRRLHELRKLHQPQGVGHVAAALSNDLRNFLLMVFELVNKRLVAGGLFEWIEVLALDVFHDSKLERLDVADIENNHGHIMQTCALCGLPTPFARYDFESIAGALYGSNGNRLNDAAFLD